MYKLSTVLARRGILGACSSWAPKVLSPMFVKSTQQSYSTSWQSVRTREQMQRQTLPVARIQNASTGTITVGRHQKRDVLEQLKLFEEAIDPRPSSMVHLLGKIARAVKVDRLQREALHKEMSRTQGSMYIKLLDSIQQTLGTLQPSDLGFTIWSLGQVREKTHPLVEACQEEILSHDMSVYDDRTISQMIMGLASLNMTEARLFKELENAILSGKVKLDAFDKRGLAQTVLSFAKTNNGSVELFDHFAVEVLSRDFSSLQNNDLIQFVWSFAKRGFKADEVFKRAEEELFLRGISNIWKSVDIAMVLWAFASQGKGSVDFFEGLVRNILEKKITDFKNDELSQCVWALGKAGVNSEPIFSHLEHEVVRRGIQTFYLRNRGMLLEGFTLAKRNEELLASLA